MDKNSKTPTTEQTSEEIAQLPVSSLAVPKYVYKLLEDNQISTVGELMAQVETDQAQLLSIRGIGPKILEQLEVAIQSLSTSLQTTHGPSYPPPVPTLADYYRSLSDPLEANEAVAEENPPLEPEPAEVEYSPPVPSLADYFFEKRTPTASENAAPSRKGKKKSAKSKAKKSKKKKRKKKKKKKKSRKGKKK